MAIGLKSLKFYILHLQSIPKLYIRIGKYKDIAISMLCKFLSDFIQYKLYKLSKSVK